MATPDPISAFFESNRFTRSGQLILATGLLFVCAIVQDYIYSQLKNTGFYLSESALYNTFWCYFFPFSIFIYRLVERFNFKPGLRAKAVWLVLSLAVCGLHILSCVLVFVAVSNLVFTPAHHFSSILKTVLANEFYLALVWYMALPYFVFWRLKQRNATSYHPKTIRLKTGAKLLNVQSNSIQLLAADKPYVVVHFGDQRVWVSKSLKAFQAALNPKDFIRVHRSSIVNKQYIAEIKSRKNGDYDALLQNGKKVRMSRHYRTNWQCLLHSAYFAHH